ncbi:hypothetical protein CONLIGDRAFT_647522 [Coniochaeta ligniaria NRRL 30616]|uniref:Uncharacterized protein n=1 Tax=Coniochaeta ligniaria NRRL 30616 TaxID=1408157 RepID=A0A1J7JDY6_9PEZI|nr:hypothetical protein CONLIGDRAFT_647522 [Coniochaeta ligniaria NRRL 30616]
MYRPRNTASPIASSSGNEAYREHAPRQPATERQTRTGANVFPEWYNYPPPNDHFPMEVDNATNGVRHNDETSETRQADIDALSEQMARDFARVQRRLNDIHVEICSIHEQLRDTNVRMRDYLGLSYAPDIGSGSYVRPFPTTQDEISSMTGKYLDHERIYRTVTDALSTLDREIDFFLEQLGEAPKDEAYKRKNQLRAAVLAGRLPDAGRHRDTDYPNEWRGMPARFS